MQIWRTKVIVLVVVLVTIVLGAGACGQTLTPQVIEKQVVVEKPVVETVVVEKEVVIEKRVVETVIVEREVPVLESVSTRKKIRVFGAWLTPKDEPWVRASDELLQRLHELGEIEYRSVDDIGYDGSITFVLEQAIAEGFQLIVGDAFGEGARWREVAAKNAAAHAQDPENVPLVYFLAGSGEGAVQPNFATYDNEIQQASYLAGVAAGATTQSKTIGIVAAKDDPEPNRLGWALIEGVFVTCPDCTILTNYIGDWFKPEIAKEAALGQIEQGADVIYAEREGAIQAVEQNPGVTAIGNLLNQNQDCRTNCVLGSVVWYQKATIEKALELVRSGQFSGIYYGQYSWFTNGGSDFVMNEGGPLSVEVRDLVAHYKSLLLDGSIRVKVVENKLPGRLMLGVDYQ